ncbi:MAG: NAD(P)/FAD-dependent oxidoreductase [Thermoproteota archaeon]|nr:NAD(P)/FAD-dependent oxidoreductase [Thermoproteota archaeon]
MDYDVTIIGAGPVGSTAAKVLADNGFNILILEEHSIIGSPQHCTGKISAEALRELDLEPVGILQEIRGATFYSPSLESFTIKSNTTQAYILDRRVFDTWLSERCVKAGASLITNARATRISISSFGVSVEFKCQDKYQTIRSRVIIAADGANSGVARQLGIYTQEQAGGKMGVQIQMKGIRDIKEDIVELYFGRIYAPGFFAWIVPLGSDEARVGLCVNIHSGKPAMNYLREFVSKHPVASCKLKGCFMGESSVHPIPTGGTLRRTVSDGVIIVGDAAGQVKSTTGGGLYYGMSCAKLAAKTLSKELSQSTEKLLRRESLAGYERSWKLKLGKEIAFSVKARSFLDSLSDNEVTYLFNALKKDDSLLSFISKEGNVDWQSRITSPVIGRLLKKGALKPNILYKFGRSFLGTAFKK